jgi:uncharacterized protein YegP (UPF0339 family)
VIVLLGVDLKAKYQVYKDVGGKYRFRLRAANNKIVVVSQAYESKASCINGIKSVQENCQSHIDDKTLGEEKLTDPKYALFVDAGLKFRFNLIASNGQIIGSSEAYESKEGCKKGIEAVKKSCGAEIEDLTVTQTAEKTVAEQCSGIEVTGIAMLAPPNVVESGTMVTFEGWLINSKTGEGIEKATIDIIEHDRSFMSDKTLASGVTAKDGSFNIPWKSYQADWWDDSVELYSKFSGKGNCKPTRSANYKIRVV